MRQTEIYFGGKRSQEIGQTDKKPKAGSTSDSQEVEPDNKAGGSQKPRKQEVARPKTGKGVRKVKEWVEKDGRVVPVYEDEAVEGPVTLVMEVEDVAMKGRRNPPIFLKEIGKVGLVKEALSKSKIETEFKVVKGGIIIITRGRADFRQAVKPLKAAKPEDKPMKTVVKGIPIAVEEENLLPFFGRSL